MISFGQHVVARGGSAETLWLNEGLSHIAEELAGKEFEARYPPPAGRTDPNQLFPDSAQGFLTPNMRNAQRFLESPGTTSATAITGSASLAERGGAWLFLRWLGDQKGEAIYGRLVQTGRTGIPNLEDKASESFAGLFGDFATAVYADSIPGVARGAIPPRLKFTTRNFRRIFQRFADIDQSGRTPPFPFAPTTIGCRPDRVRLFRVRLHGLLRADDEHERADGVAAVRAHGSAAVRVRRQRADRHLSSPMTRRRVARRIASLAVIALVVFLLTPTGCYLSRAGWEEAKILAGRRQIVRLVDDATTDPATRDQLRLVLAARGFAADSLRLRTGESFTTYSHLDRDTLVLVVSGAYRDRLEAYTWWFPIVGRVPYKGFFDFSAALDLARDLERAGFDSYVRPSAAFSTLGWFNDPLLSTSLRADSISLANTVIHEVTHNTFYKAGQAVFNESFANFVGARGSAWFFRTRGDSGAAAFADADWEDDKRMGAFWASLYRSLDSAYKALPGDSARAARLAARDTVYARGRTRLVQDVGPTLRTLSPERVARIRIDNNAALLARRSISPTWSCSIASGRVRVMIFAGRSSASLRSPRTPTTRTPR